MLSTGLRKAAGNGADHRVMYDKIEHRTMLASLASEGMFLGASPATEDSPCTLVGDGSSPTANSPAYSSPSGVGDESIEALREERNVLRSKLQKANAELVRACTLYSKMNLYLGELNEDLKASEQRCSAASAQLDALEKGSMESKSEAARKIDVLEAGLSKKDEAIKELKCLLAAAEGVMEGLKAQRDALEKEREEAESEAARKIDFLEAGLSKKDEAIKELQALNEEIKALNEDLKARLRSLEASLANRDEELWQSKSEVDERASKIKVLEAELTKKDEKIKKLESDSNKVTGQLKANEAELEKVKSNVREMGSEISKHEAELANRNYLESEMGSEISRLKTELANKNYLESEMGSEISKLKAELANKNYLESEVTRLQQQQHLHLGPLSSAEDVSDGRSSTWSNSLGAAMTGRGAARSPLEESTNNDGPGATSARGAKRSDGTGASKGPDPSQNGQRTVDSNQHDQRATASPRGASTDGAPFSATALTREVFLAMDVPTRVRALRDAPPMTRPELASVLLDFGRFPMLRDYIDSPDLPPEQRALKDESRRLLEQRRLQQLSEPTHLFSPPSSTRNGGLTTETSGGDLPAVNSSTRPRSLVPIAAVGGTGTVPHQANDRPAPVIFSFLSRLSEAERRPWDEYLAVANDRRNDPTFKVEMRGLPRYEELRALHKYHGA
jgi:septal ring factor EnvC (AmiA/AmiB activator)